MVAERVMLAREVQRARYEAEGATTLVNAQCPPALLEKVAVRRRPGARAAAGRGRRTGALSARGYHRVVKVADWTWPISTGRPPSADPLAEALSFRIVGERTALAA